jgi:hypothetical protein
LGPIVATNADLAPARLPPAIGNNACWKYPPRASAQAWGVTSFPASIVIKSVKFCANIGCNNGIIKVSYSVDSTFEPI